MPMIDFLGDWNITYGGRNWKRVIYVGGGGAGTPAPNNICWYDEGPVLQGQVPSGDYAGRVDNTTNLIRLNPAADFDVTGNLSADGNSIIAADGTTIVGTRTSFTTNLSSKVYSFTFDEDSDFLNTGVQIVLFFPDDNYIVWAVTDENGVAVSGIGGFFKLTSDTNGFLSFSFTLSQQNGHFLPGEYTFRFKCPPGNPDQIIVKGKRPKRPVRGDEENLTATAISGG